MSEVKKIDAIQEKAKEIDYKRVAKNVLTGVAVGVVIGGVGYLVGRNFKAAEVVEKVVEKAPEVVSNVTETAEAVL